jgi:ADP-ribose pyrophosphatase
LLDVCAATLPDLLVMAGDGRITDAKTLAGMLWLQHVVSGSWPLVWSELA